MKVATWACLFVSKDGGCAVRIIEAPLEHRYQLPPGTKHAVKVPGPNATIRVFKQTAEGGVPVYEEE